MRVKFLVGLALIALAVPAFAQRGQQGGQPRQNPRGGPPGGAQRMDQMTQQIADELGLDDAQRAQFDQIVAKQRERMAETRQRWQEMRDAQRNGDEAKAAELRDQLTPQGGGPQNPMAGLLDEVEPILRNDQKAKLEAVRERFAQRGPGGGMMNMMGRLQGLADDLKLDDGQRQKYDAIVAKFQEENQGRRGRQGEMGDIYRELRDARDNGDETRAQELEQKIAEMRPDPQKMMESFFNEVEGILREDQKAILAAQKEEFMRGGGARGRNRGGDDPRVIFRAVKRLDLNEDQKTALKDIEKDAMDALEHIRASRDRDRNAQAELAAKVRQEVTGILSPEQLKQFEKEMNRELGGPGQQRQGRPARPGAGQPPAPAGQGQRTP